jgi:Zn-dependent protease
MGWFQSLKHIDPVGTISLPAMLLLLRSPFLFGYVKPVPGNFRALRNPRTGTILVAAAETHQRSLKVSFFTRRGTGLSSLSFHGR